MDGPPPDRRASSHPWTADTPLIRTKRTLVDHFRAVLLESPDAHAYRFLSDSEAEPHSISNADLDLRARAIAATLAGRVPEGERALIVCPSGLDYVAAFLGCLYARVIAVPVYPPNPVLLKRTLPRLLGVIEDARPGVVLAPSSITSIADEITAQAPGLESLWWQSVDAIDPDAAQDWQRPAFDLQDVAFLQYTSGSTGQPKGVVLSHANLLSNLEAANRRFIAGGNHQQFIAGGDHVVTWLPPYHDMGLIGALLQPIYAGIPVTFMSPVSFLKRPGLWLRTISDVGGTVSGGPNFAYELCVAKVSEEERARLDLSNWRVAFSGSEPVRAATVERFAEAFASCGFRRSAFFPCYGMAEATLFVSGGPRATDPTVRRLNADALARHEAVDAGPDEPARDVVSCGLVADGHEVAIVDPDTGTRLPQGRVGEIWVSGPSIAQGYWNRPELSDEVFRARTADTGEGPFLRTGDLGFLAGDQVYVTGRRKDLIIIAGRNHYPHDIERTAGDSHPALRPGAGIACSVDIDDEERLVIVHEVTGSGARLPADSVISSIRAAVAEEHGVQVHDIVLIRPGAIPKTSSGKLQRSACRTAFLEGALDPVAIWRAGTVDAAPSPWTTPAPATPTARSAPAAAAVTRAEVERHLLGELASRLNVPAHSLDPTRPVATYGLNSADMVGIVGDVERWLGRSLPATLLWEYPTVDALAGHLSATGDRAEPAAATRSSDAGGPDNDPIAIIGIGCRFPGGADSPDAFWRLLREGRDAVTEVPADRWDVEALTDEDASVPGRTTTRWGGFLDGVDLFDAHFFGISPHEAARIDPQQRLLAEVAWEAFEDAGLVPERLAGSATGVFVGIATSDYSHRTFQDLARIDAYTGTGNAFSIAANRLSYLFDLRGPSVSVDTACSSSLVAVYQACTSLSRGDCDLAIAGGVNLVLSPALAINFSKAGAMASDGRCKAFDARADGYVRSEGAGAVILKPLSRAVADGDPVYGVIVGGAVNQDGRTNGLMAPNPHAQEAVLRAAYQRAGVAPERVRYVEAHGTGTLLGDPIEAKALSAVLAADRDPGSPLLIGSVKSNLGHLEAAAGIAGLIKTALMLRHRGVPASLHFERPNPHIPFEDLRLRVANGFQAWPAADCDEPAFAGVSSFGFGGTNAHLVLSGPPQPAATGPDGVAQPVRPLVLTMSARGDDALRDLAARYDARLAEPDAEAELDGICVTAAVRRSHHEVRLAAVGGTTEDLRAALAAYANGEERPGLSWGSRRVGRRPQVVFVFSGQGPRWWPLAADLIDGEPVFRAALNRADEALREHVDWSLIEALTSGAATLADPAVAQPALCAVQIALAALWRSWGIEPAAVVGHSVGEVAAAQVAGALTLSDALTVAWHRGRVIRSAIGQGRMAVLGLGLDASERLLAERGITGVWVAASNGPNSTVLSGHAGALQALAGSVEADGIFCRLLESVEFASHSPQMQPSAQELGECLAGLRARATTVPMYSTVTGRPVDGATLGGAYWAANLRQPVLFDPAVTALVEAGHDAFVEISPHPMLVEVVAERMSVQQSQGIAVASLRRDEPGRAALLGQLGRLYTAGYPVDWQLVFGAAGPIADLPSYPWQRQRYWIDDEYPRPRAGRTGHPVLETFVRSAAEPRGYHASGRVDLAGFPYLRDHQVGDTPVLPASLFLDAALAAARRATGTDAVVEDIALTRLTAVDDEAEDATIQFVLLPQTSGAGTLRLFTRGPGEPADGWTEAGQGRFRAGGTVDPTTERLAAVRARCARAVDRAGHYAKLGDAGLRYGPAFQGIAEAWRGDGEAVAELRRPDALTDRDPYLVHPAMLDSALQVLGAALDAEDGRAVGTYVPVSVGRFGVTSERVAPRWAYARIGDARPGAAEITGCRVVLYDEAGEPVGEVADITLRRLDGADGADPVGEAMFEVRWRALDEEPADQRASGWWLLLADRGDVCANLRTELVGQGATCVTVVVGERYRRIDANTYEVDPSRAEDFAALLSDASGDATTRCAGVVHVWSLDTDQPDDLAEHGSQEHASVAVLHLVQALTRANASPRLVLATRGAQQVGDETSVPALAQAELWGLLRVLALEHGELRPVIVDLDPAEDGRRAASRLLAEALRSGDLTQVAVRGGKRYTPRLGGWRPPTGTDPDPRPFDPERDGNYRVLATRPGILGSLAPVLWERAAPGPGQVQIEIAAAGLNFSDVLKAMDICPGVPPGITPLGAECAGRVVAVGDDVDGLRVGDAVMAVAPSSMAAFTTTTAELVARVPDGLTDEQAAAVPIAFLTAVYGLEYMAHLGPGDTVLIHSATGGVGLAALQVAQRNGAEVFATAGTERKRAMLRDLGVKHVMDSRSLDFSDQVRELTGGRGVDVVLNSLTGEALLRGLSLLAPNGRFVEIGKQDIYANSHIGLEILKQNRSFLAVDLERSFAEQPRLIARLFAEVRRGFDNGEFTALPVTTFRYAEAYDAFSFMAQARHTGKIVLRPDGREAVAPAPGAAPIRPGATYLITGGLGALGLHTARYLAHRGARHLALVGRGQPSEPARRALDDLVARGVDVQIRHADVSRYDEVAALVADLDATMPPLAGVVHAAGVLDDGLLLQLTRDRFRTVSAPKAAGAWHLHRATEHHDLDFFVLYSSAAALLGSPGQGNYAAANAFLDGLALYRRAQGKPGLSINWGPWAEAGLAASPDRGGALSGRGMVSLSPREGVDSLDRLLRTSTAWSCVLPLDRARLREAAGSGLLPALLTDLLGAGGTAAAGPRQASGEVRQKLLAVEPGRRRRNLLVQHCATEVARVLKVDLSRIDTAAPLASMGFDSLMSLELRKRLEASMDIELPATVVWRFPTIEALAPFLAERMGVDLEAAATTATPDGTGGPAAGGTDEDLEQELEALSDDDVEALLMAKIMQIDEGRQG